MDAKEVILVVEDQEDVLEFMTCFLSAYYQVDSCTKLQEAMEKTQKATYSAVILDLNLPCSTGIGTFVKYKQFLKHHKLEVPVVVITGHDKDVGLSAVKNGAQDFLQKGFYSNEQLLQSIRFAVLRNQNVLEAFQALKDEFMKLLEECKGLKATTEACILKS